MQTTTALVLAGGINLGFSVLTHNRAKSALPFCGHFRVIDFVLTNLSRSGISNVGILIQYLPGSLIDHVGVGSAWDYATTNRRLKLMPPFIGMGKTEWFRGSADAIYQNLNYVSDTRADLVLVLSADHVYSMDYGPLIEFHRYHNADLTVVTTERSDDLPPDLFGYVSANEKGRVQEFIEKPLKPPH
ncbi:glucose-1-phosphate adenylyltransferase, partial [bacterium]|nr:glucose-1-phosphate adenylyltransferase [bacterium]